MDNWKISSNEGKSKLLPFLKEKYKKTYSLKQIRFAIEHNQCFVDGVVERFASKELKMGQEVAIQILPHSGFTYEPERLLFEDSHFIAYDKPPFIPSTWGLDEVLSKHFGPLFPVHRLDRDTTGVLLFAKSPECQARFKTLFKNRVMHKTYHALVYGKPHRSQGKITMHLAPQKKFPGKTLWGRSTREKGKFSETFWKCEKRGKDYSLLTCIPLTGRTHQIRIHLQSIGHPVVGDFDYGMRKLRGLKVPKRLMLHAYKLVFAHPFASTKITLQANLPEDFSEFCNGKNENAPNVGNQPFHNFCYKEHNFL